MSSAAATEADLELIDAAGDAVVEQVNRRSRRSAAQVRARVHAVLPDGLWGNREVADELGVTVSNLHHITDLPEPVMRVRATRLWLPPEIREFAVVYKARRPAPRAAQRA